MFPWKKALVVSSGLTMSFLGSFVLCMMMSGCGLTLGPQTETRIIIPHAGKPCRVIQKEKTELEVQQISSGATAKQDISGWVAMPEEHFDALMKKLDEYEAALKK